MAQLNLTLAEGSTPAWVRLNQGADMLSRSNVPSEEWMLHPQVVQKIWKTFGKAEVAFSPPKTTLTAQLIIRRTGTRWPTTGPTSSLCIPPITLLPQVVGVSGNRVTRCYWWPPCGGTNLGCQSWLSYWQQPGPCPWDGISSLRRTEQYGTLDPSCGLSTFGHSTGAYRPPRASVKHNFWG